MQTAGSATAEELTVVDWEDTVGYVRRCTVYFSTYGYYGTEIVRKLYKEGVHVHNLYTFARLDNRWEHFVESQNVVELDHVLMVLDNLFWNLGTCM